MASGGRASCRRVDTRGLQAECHTIRIHPHGATSVQAQVRSINMSSKPRLSAGLCPELHQHRKPTLLSCALGAKARELSQVDSQGTKDTSRVLLMARPTGIRVTKGDSKGEGLAATENPRRGQHTLSYEQ